MCTDYDLLELYIKFRYVGSHWYDLNNSLYFYFYGSTIDFKGKILSVNDFIEEILTNYPECYKYDYSQIKTIIDTKSN